MAHRRPTVIAATSVIVAVGCTAGANAPALQPQLDTPAPIASTPDSGSNAEADAEVEVQVDLSANGMAARVRAPKSAAVRAASSEIEIVGGPNYHLLLGRGVVDPLGEKARIVRAYGDEFRRYLRDDGDLLVYETGTDREQRFHFFMLGQTGELAYHCRTPPEGIGALASVHHMVEVCRGVEATTDTHVPRP